MSKNADHTVRRRSPGKAEGGKTEGGKAEDGNDARRDLYDEAKGHPHGGQHVGRQGTEGQHQQRPKPSPPIAHPSDEKLGQ